MLNLKILKMVYKFEEFNESNKVKKYLITALMSLGLSSSFAQDIDNNKKVNLIDSLYKYNQNPIGLEYLKKRLHDDAMNYNELITHIDILPNGMITLRPSVIPNLSLITNTRNPSFGIGWRYNF